MKFLCATIEWKSVLVIFHRSQHSQTHIEPLIMCCDKNQIRSTFKCTNGGCAFHFVAALLSLHVALLRRFPSFPFYFLLAFFFSILIMVSQFAFERNYTPVAFHSIVAISGYGLGHAENQCCFRAVYLAGIHIQQHTIQIGWATFALMNSSAFSFRRVVCSIIASEQTFTQRIFAAKHWVQPMAA